MCITIFWQRETHVGAPRGVSDVEHSPNVTTVRGVDTLLNCRVHQLTNMTGSWIKHGGVHLLAVGRYLKSFLWSQFWIFRFREKQTVTFFWINIIGNPTQTYNRMNGIYNRTSEMYHRMNENYCIIGLQRSIIGVTFNRLHETNSWITNLMKGTSNRITETYMRINGTYNRITETNIPTTEA